MKYKKQWANPAKQSIHTSFISVGENQQTPVSSSITITKIQSLSNRQSGHTRMFSQNKSLKKITCMFGKLRLILEPISRSVSWSKVNSSVKPPSSRPSQIPSMALPGSVPENLEIRPIRMAVSLEKAMAQVILSLSNLIPRRDNYGSLSIVKNFKWHLIIKISKTVDM